MHMQPNLRLIDGGLGGPQVGASDWRREPLNTLTDDERTDAARKLMELAAAYCFKAPTLALCCRRLAIWVTKGVL
jgi:hypothetical protein